MSSSRDSNSEYQSDYSAYLEVTEDGSWTGHVLDLPGCVAFGNSRDAVVQALSRDVINWHRWLRAHGEPVALPSQLPRLEIVETVEDVSPARKSGEAVALFTPDLGRVTDEMIDRTLTLLRYCHGDLVAKTGNQPDSLLNARLAPGHRSVVEIARHMGQAECWYLTRLEPRDDEQVAAHYQRVSTGEPLDALRDLLRFAEHRFRAWTTEQRTERFVPQHNSRYGTEIWTARKVLRRFVEHRREHIDEIQRTIEATPL